MSNIQRRKVPSTVHSEENIRVNGGQKQGGVGIGVKKGQKQGEKGAKIGVKKGRKRG